MLMNLNENIKLLQPLKGESENHHHDTCALFLWTGTCETVYMQLIHSDKGYIAYIWGELSSDFLLFSVCQ